MEEPNQDYYWTPEWQKGEKEADYDIKNKIYHTFDTSEDAIIYLHGLS